MTAQTMEKKGDEMGAGETKVRMIRFADGGEEHAPFVALMMDALKRLFDEEPMAFLEFVEKCRDSGHKLFGNSFTLLRRHQDLFISHDGKINDSIRRIVLHQVTGEGLGMTISPIIAAPVEEIGGPR